MNDGGPAFPVESQTERFGKLKGMSLRDYFAAKAMESLVKSYCDPTCSPSTNKKLVSLEAYEIADEMLRAREVKS